MSYQSQPQILRLPLPYVVITTFLPAHKEPEQPVRNIYRHIADYMTAFPITFSCIYGSSFDSQESSFKLGLKVGDTL